MWGCKPQKSSLPSIFPKPSVASLLNQLPEPVFVNLLRSPGIDSQSSGQVHQPSLSYRPAGLRNRFLGFINVYKYRLWSDDNLLHQHYHKTQPHTLKKEAFFQRSARVTACDHLVSFLLVPVKPCSSFVIELVPTGIPNFFPFTYLVWFELGSLNDDVM